MVIESIYDFSFTGFSLRLKEMVKVATAKSQNIEFNAVQEIGNGNTKTTKNFLNDINKRLNSLTEEELTLFVEGDLHTQRQIAFLSVCKVHGYIRDFVVEVLREKVLVYDYQISEGEYLSFHRRKLDERSKMNDFSELTHKKIRQVLFKILEQAGIIDNTKNKEIQPQLVDSKLMRIIANDDKEWLKLFFVSDTDIENFN
ncbi:MAG: hypothetical protein CMC13_14775 [Flavobacteriaceae bacterium]|nr:hypothetical protein [Flavobacteriaceae bacterium]|tara:strand:+ start:63 stop:662 length:600 start_codon:yes stop_codon:yes gene_type:complete